MKILKFVTSVSKKLAKAESWKLPSKKPAPLSLPPPPPIADELKPVVGQDAAPVETVAKEEAKLAPVVEDAYIPPIPPKEEEEPKPIGRKRALLIGIQCYPDPSLTPEEILQEQQAKVQPPIAPSVPPLPSTPSPPPASAAAPTAAAAVASPPPSAPISRAETSASTAALASTTSLASITSRAKSKFKQTILGTSPLASASTLPSIPHSAPLPLQQTRTYANVVSPSAGLGGVNGVGAWPPLGSASSVVSPKTPTTRVPLKPGRSFRQEEAKRKKSKSKKVKEVEVEAEKSKENEKVNMTTTKAEVKGQTGEGVQGAKRSGKEKHCKEASTSSYALKGCHRDVEEMEKALIDLYGYPPESITKMLDTRENIDSNSPLLPTRDNILAQLDILVKDAQPGDRFFFFFAGHSTQEATDSLEEEDGMDELIVTYDNSTVRDDELRERLVLPLPIGAQLVAVFDSCHSASLLDLEHFRCNRTWVPWMNKGKRRSMSRMERIVRKAAAPLSPRRMSLSPAYVASPVSTHHPLLSPIFDMERIRRAVSRKRRREVKERERMEEKAGRRRQGEEMRMKEIEDVRRREEAWALEQAQKRARGLDAVLSESMATVPEVLPLPSSSNTKPPMAEGKENVAPAGTSTTTKPARPDPRNRQRAKIVPPPVYDGWMKSSLDHMRLGGSGSSEGGIPSAGLPSAAIPSAPATGILTNNIPKPRPNPRTGLTPIRTTSLHPPPERTDTAEISPVQQQQQQQHVTFTPQTYSPLSSRRDSANGSTTNILSRRESVTVKQVLEQVDEAIAKKEGGRKRSTGLSNISNTTDKTDRTDATFPASDASDDSGIWWLTDEPQPFMNDPEGDLEDGEEGGKRGRVSRMPSLGATSSLAMNLDRVSRSKSVARAWSKDVLEKTKDMGKGVKKRYPRRCMSPEERFCTGWCGKQWREGGVDGRKAMPFVISLSAAKDGQQAWEDATGASMTHHLVAILRREPPGIPLERLLNLISHDLHDTYLDIHANAREYRKKAREWNKKRRLRGKEEREPEAVEMINFQDPQVSSLWPLDMTREIWDP